MKRKYNKLIIGLSVLLISLALLRPIALAAEPINVFMPMVSITLTGAPQQDSEDYEIVLKADDPAFPMPSGSEDGEYKLIVTGNDMATLPAIQFSSIGIYTYTISQTPGTNDLGNYDDSLFNITVYITNAPNNGGLESTVIAREMGGPEKLFDIEFINDYELELPDEEIPGGEAKPPEEVPDDEIELPDQETPGGEIELPDDEIPGGDAELPDPPQDDVPKTGDNTLIWPFILSFIGAGVLLLILTFTNKKRARE